MSSSEITIEAKQAAVGDYIAAEGVWVAEIYENGDQIILRTDQDPFHVSTGGLVVLKADANLVVQRVDA